MSEEIENKELEEKEEQVEEEQQENTVEEESTSEEDLNSNDLSDEEFEKLLNTRAINSRRNQVVEEDEKEDEDENEKDEEVDSKKEKEEESTSEEKSSTNINYEDIYKSIFKPFKANGKEITPKTADDVISLMQMGANYTKKMQTIAPMRKTMESLNRANISNEDLSFLIDLHKGDKEAIKSLLKKHNIDPMDLDLDNNSYVNNQNNIVSDKDVEYSNTIEDVKDSLVKINDIINNKWDADSKQRVLTDPKLLRALHEEIELGRFDQVQQILDEERMYGRYKDMSDIDAYSDIVTKIVKHRAEQISKQNNIQQQQVQKPTRNVPDKTKAAPIRNRPKNQGRTLTSEDIFSMSDEEFNKLSERDLY